VDGNYSKKFIKSWKFEIHSPESFIVLHIINNWVLFQEHHEEDFFLYIAYSDESVYGN